MAEKLDDTMTERLDRLRAAYGSGQCACRGTKKRRRAFCTRCTRALVTVRAARTRLEGSVTDPGTAEAYAECLEELKRESYVAEGTVL